MTKPISERVTIERRGAEYWVIRDGVLIAGHADKSAAQATAKQERAKLRRVIRRQFGEEHPATR